jgi:ATP-dependent DNA helicase PIF1
VDAANAVRMAALPSTDLRTYYAQDGGKLPSDQRQRVLDGFMAPPTLLLKVDAQVMLIKKIDDELVNGTVGRVIRFTDAARWNREGAAPTAKSAAPPPPGASSRLEWPLVEFRTAKGNAVHALVGPECFKTEFPDGKVAASRIQVQLSHCRSTLRGVSLTQSHQLPLILSWAMSIHKAQGQTLERVRVDLGGVFANGTSSCIPSLAADRRYNHPRSAFVFTGHAYVALSRATSMACLQVLNFNPSQVRLRHARPCPIRQAC